MRIMNVPCLSPPPLRPEYFATLRECMLEALAEQQAHTANHGNGNGNGKGHHG